MDVSIIVKILLMALGAALTGVLIPWLRTKTTQAQRERLGEWIQIAVTAAEQIFAADQGAQKKAWVLQWLQENKVDVSDTQIDAMIEAAVYELTK